MLNVLPKHSPGHQVTLDGYLVPHIQVGENNGRWSVILHGRFGIEDCSYEELRKWLWLLANAQAIGAGYSCHGENCQPLNPFKVKCVCVEIVLDRPPTLTIVKPDETAPA